MRAEHALGHVGEDAHARDRRARAPAGSGRCRPPPDRAVATFSCTLPNPSTPITPAAERARGHHRAGHLERRSSSDRRWPDRAPPAACPFARCAAAGANTSRPWNVLRHREQHDARSVDRDGRLGAPERLPGHREQPVVGTHQERARGRAHGDRPALRAHARIDDRHVDGVGGHVRGRAAQRERAAHHVLARDRVREVDHPDVRARSEAMTPWHTPTNSSARP